MNYSERKIEMSILGLSILMVGALVYLFKTPVQNVVAEVQEIIYEMPRPKNSFLAALFDLNDREISRKYVNPFDKKKAEAKKTEEAKTAPAAVAAKKAEPKKSAQKKAETAQKKVTDIQIVGSSPEKNWGADDISKVRTAGAGAPGIVANAEEAKPKSATAQDKNGLSSDQWRALLMAQPTQENVAKLMQAYAAGEVEEQTVYTVVTDLFRNNKSEVQNLGLVALNSIYTERSFSLVAEFYDQLASDIQPKAHKYLMSYAVTPRLPILAEALKSNNSNVVETALEVVIAGHKAAQNGGNLSGDPRNTRGDVATSSLASYSKFIPFFRQLAQSSDPQIAGLANTALGQIQTTVATL